MSLVNDALKRAKELQRCSPAAIQEETPIASAKPHPAPSGLPRLTHPKPVPWLTLTGIVLLAAILVWEGIRQGGSGPKGGLGSAVKPQANSSGSTLTTVPAATGPEPPDQTATSATNSPPALTDSAKAPSNQAVAAPKVESPAVASPAVVALPTPAATADRPHLNPSTFKLQAIVFHPTRPCVIINGKTLFLGDQIEDYRMVAVDRMSVTLTGAGRTNILTLP